MSLFEGEAFARWKPDCFRDDLRTGGFSAGLFEGAEPGAQGRVVFIPESRRQEFLLLLFVEGKAVARAEACEALPTSFQEVLEIGLLVTEGESVRSVLRLRAFEDGVFADDFPRRLFDHADDFVMGVASTTRIVKSLIPKSGVGAAKILDLCCGGGWLGITLKKSNGNSVIGTDLNPRAIGVARLNAALNDADGIDWRVGAWYDEVKDEKFNLVISNPPFVVSPGNQAVALDTGGNESAISAVLGGAPAQLLPGGYLCSLLDWPFESEEDWSRVPLSCFKRDGLQTLLFELKRLSPEEYARHWVGQDPRFEEQEKFKKEVDRWVRYLKGSGYLGVSSGFAVVRKCEPGEEWLLEESRELSAFNSNTSLDLARIFEGRTWLQKNDEDLLDLPFEVTEGLIETRQSVLKGGEWEAGSLKLTSPGLVAYDGFVDVSLIAILTALSAGRVTREILDELAAPLGLQGEAISDQVAGLLQELISCGIILPK